MSVIFGLVLICFCTLLFSCEASRKEKKHCFRPEASEHCYGDLGCIKTGTDWYDKKLRPDNVVPDSRHTIKTQFFIYKRGHYDKKGLPKGDLMILSEEGMGCMSKFSPNFETKILIHDFTSSGEAGWTKHFMKSMFTKADWNIIVVDWESGAGPPFIQAVANARLVALEIIFMIDVLIDKAALNLEDVHLIGQGVGAHIAGYVGEELCGVGRITGLDPTGVYFEGLPIVVRLDESDALFVDVIHTDGLGIGKGGQGMIQPIGHVDYYPNGGHHQPGCSANSTYPSLLKLTRDSIGPGQVLPGCSHKRASKYFIETVSNIDCPFVGFHCENYTSLLDGKCLGPASVGPSLADRRNVMGLMADAYPKPANANSKYYLRTADETKFCMYPYSIIVHLAKTKTSKLHVEGKLFVRIHQADVHAEINLTPKKERRFMEHGKPASFFAYHPLRVGLVDHLEMKWEYISDAKHTSAICLLCNDSLYVGNITVVSLGYYPPKNQTVMMCSEDNEYGEIKHGQTRLFVKCTTKKKQNRS